MIRKGLVIWLIVLVSYGSAGPRIKRSLFSISQPPPAPSYPYPIWKVHRYTGVQLQPVEAPNKENPTENETPSIESSPDYTVSEQEEPDEEDTYESGGLGSVLSLIPGGLTGLISLSTGSGRNEDETDDYEGRVAEDRFDLLGLKKDILTSVLQKKKELLTALKRDALQLVIRKAKAKKAWIKSLLFGRPHPGYYYTVPSYYYPKKSGFLSYLPFVGHWFGGGTQLPEVHLPHVPNLIALKDPPHLPVIDLQSNYQFPYQSGTYVKVDYPGKDKPDVEYQVPGTSYGVPESPISVPQLPYYEKNPPSFAQPTFTTEAPEVAVPEAYPYPPAESQYNQPAHEPVYPYPVSYPYPKDPYANDYYDTAQSEIKPVKEIPQFGALKEPKKGSKEKDIIQDRLDEDSTVDGSVNGGYTETTTEIFHK